MDRPTLTRDVLDEEPGDDPPPIEIRPFHNPTSETLVVKGVSTTCPCAMGVITTTEIPAGGKGQLEIMVDPTLTAKEFGAFVSVEYVKPQKN